MRVEIMSLADLLATVTPTDYRPRTWDAVFQSIEQNHHASDPAYWNNFLESIRTHGIESPLKIYQRDNQLYMLNGHHRVWAAHRLGMKEIPVIIDRRFDQGATAVREHNAAAMIVDSLLEYTPDFDQTGGSVSSPQGRLKDMSVEQVEPNIVIFFEEKGNFFKPAGWIMAYFMDSEQSALDIMAGKITPPMFLPGSLSMRFQGYSMIDAIWKKPKKIPRETPQDRAMKEASRHVVGALEAYKEDKRIFVDNLSVRPGWKRNTIGTKLMQALEKEFPGLPIDHSETTKAGYQFMKKTGYLKPSKEQPGAEPSATENESLNATTGQAIVQAILEDDDPDAWIGVDFDGTLATHTTGKYRAEKTGKPIPKMVNRVRRWVGHGKKVKIFTARADDEVAVNAIKKWLKANELPDFEVTNVKSPDMIEFWDDKAVAVEKNTGEVKESIDPYAAVIYALLGAGWLNEFYTLWKYPALRQKLKANWKLMKNDATALWKFIKDNSPKESRDKTVAGDLLAEKSDAEAIEQAIFNAMSANVAGIKHGDEGSGHYVYIPADLTEDPDDEPMAIGPFVDQEAAQTFLDSEVGAPGAKVVLVNATRRQLEANAVVRSLLDDEHEDITEAHRVNPMDMQRSLEFLRRRNPTGYAQLLLLPFGPVPSYAWEDPASEWWSSPKAFERLAMIRQAASEGVKSMREDSVIVVGNYLLESPEIETLKKNARQLDPEEREQVMKAGAVWHMGKDGAASPAVRKAVVNGKTWYWCATHRAGQVRPTLKGAIKAFDFVKTTA